MLVVEGSDGAGKTTLANHLTKKYGFKLGERGVANRDLLYKVTRQDTYRALSAAVLGQEPVEIWDRLGVPSEFVYHDLVGRRCEFTTHETEFVLGVMNSLKMPMIVCVVPYSVAEANCHKEHQMKGVNENLRTIWNRYANLMIPHPDNTVVYDYTGQLGHATLQDIEDEVEGYLMLRKERQAWQS